MADEKQQHFSGGPMAGELADRLRREILAKYQPGGQLPSEPALARKHKRSRVTVRKALAILEAQGLIIRKHGSGTYVSDRLPRATGTTGLFFYTNAEDLLGWSFVRNAYCGMLEGTVETKRHIHLLLGYQHNPSTLSRDVADRIDLNRIDSILCLELFTVDVLAALGRQIPTVVVDFACRHVNGVSSCALDHSRNVGMAIEHLWRLGHRRIGLVGDVESTRRDPAVAGRRGAFLAAMKTHRLTVIDDYITSVVDAAGAVRLMRRWRRASPADRPTAMLCLGTAWPIAQAAVADDIRVPGDLSLMSLDDPGPWLSALHLSRHGGVEEYDVELVRSGRPTDLMNQRFAPLRNMQFSSVVLPFRQMGRWAMEEVLRRVRDPLLTPRHELFTGSLTSGNTVAPPA